MTDKKKVKRACGAMYFRIVKMIAPDNDRLTVDLNVWEEASEPAIGGILQSVLGFPNILAPELVEARRRKEELLELIEYIGSVT